MTIIFNVCTKQNLKEKLLSELKVKNLIASFLCEATILYT
jgi:hypothetical protein